MAWAGSITDTETARKASSSVLQAASLLGLVDGNLTSLAAAQAACDAGQLALAITDRNYAVHSDRGLEVCAAFTASSVTSSSLATLYADFPDTVGHQRRMIS
jgi:hypothetical protein